MVQCHSVPPSGPRFIPILRYLCAPVTCPQTRLASTNTWPLISNQENPNPTQTQTRTPSRKPVSAARDTSNPPLHMTCLPCTAACDNPTQPNSSLTMVTPNDQSWTACFGTQQVQLGRNCHLRNPLSHLCISTVQTGSLRTSPPSQSHPGEYTVLSATRHNNINCLIAKQESPKQYTGPIQWLPRQSKSVPKTDAGIKASVTRVCNVYRSLPQETPEIQLAVTRVCTVYPVRTPKGLGIQASGRTCV